MGTNRVVFLDRDGTLNEDLGYVHTVETFEWMPGAREALKYFKNQGYLLIVLSNQSGIARGYFLEDNVRILHGYIQQHLVQTYHVQIDAFYFCPHHPDGIIPEYSQKCLCRKPGTKLIEEVMAEKKFRRQR